MPSSRERASASNVHHSGTMFRAVPPVIIPTFALVSSSMRPRRRSAIAREAARIAERPSSGYIPAWAARPWKRAWIATGGRRAEDDLADRRRLVVHVSELRLEPVVVERVAPSRPTSSFGVKSELHAGVRPVLGHDPPRRLEHHHHGRLVVGAEDRAAGVAHDTVLHDRLDRPRSAARCRGARRERAACPRLRRPGSRQRMFPIVEPTSHLRRPRPTRGRARRASATTRRRPPAPRPGGLGIAHELEEQLEDVGGSACDLTASTATTAPTAPARARAQRRRSRGTAAPAASDAT